MLTLADIRAQATAASFSKGQAYFEEGAVHRLRYREADQFYSAVVSGTEEYDVELTLNDEEGAVFWCNCPYDYEGICKHCVAVGLAVLEKQEADAAPKKAVKSGPSALLKIVRDTAPAETLPDSVSASELETALRDVPKPEQLKFLALHLRQNPTLARAFLSQFVGPPLPPDPLDADPTLPRLEDLRDELRRALSRLRFDYNSLADDDGNPPRIFYGYGPNSRFLSDLAARIAEVLLPVLGPVATAIREALLVGKLAEGLRRWHGAWLGISSLQKPAADTYNLFFGNYYARQVADTWLGLLPEMGVTRLLAEQPFAAAEVARCLPVFVRAVLEPAGPATPTASRLPARGRAPGPASPPLPDADLALLLAVAGNPSVAPALREQLRPHAHQVVPALQLQLAAGCHDWATWEPLARQQAAHDLTLLTQLLHYYHERERLQELVALAEHYFGQHQSKQLVADFVLANLRPAQARALYIKALTHRLENELDFADYEALAELWTAKERTKYGQRVLVQLPHKFPPQFRARVLAAENRVPDMLPLLLQADWHTKNKRPYWQTPVLPLDLVALPELLLLAARHQPETTLDAVMERVEDYLEKTSVRSIELYEHVAGWLKALREVPVLAEQVELFAQGLFDKYNKLAHLRRALRAAALLPEPEPQPQKPPRPGRGGKSAARPAKNPFRR